MPLTPDPYEVESFPEELANENAPDAAATAIEGNESIPSRRKKIS